MRFTEEHEWLRVDGDVVVVGITEHASEQLGVSDVSAFGTDMRV